MKRVWQCWENFWFAPLDLRYVGLFRFAIGLGLLIMHGMRFLDRDILLYENGLVSVELAKEFLPEFYRSSLQWVPGSDAAVFWTHAVYLVGLVGLTLGLFDRIGTWLLLFLHLSLIQRNFTVIYGAELIASFWLFYLGFIRHAKCFSLWRCWQSGQWTWRQFVGWWQGAVPSDLLCSMGVRLIQIQLCVIYGYTGLEKLKGHSWWEGSAVWKVLGNTQLAPVDFSFMSQLLVSVALMTMFTVVFEVYFPMAVWIPKLRGPWLLIGAVFHGGAAVLMGLPFFSLLMVSSYCVFWSTLSKQKGLMDVAA